MVVELSYVIETLIRITLCNCRACVALLLCVHATCHPYQINHTRPSSSSLVCKPAICRVDIA